MKCDDFRRACDDGIRDGAMLGHLRSCAECLEYGIAADPDLLFRSIGGGNIEPPGGVDLFAAEVMQQIHLRKTEKSTRRTWSQSPVRWAAAAAIVAALAGSISFLGPDSAKSPVSSPSPVAELAIEPDQSENPLFVPVVDQYDSENAMIVEMPYAQDDEIRVVMIFDENLPMDL